jgi:hypothetical protein
LAHAEGRLLRRFGVHTHTPQRERQLASDRAQHVLRQPAPAPPSSSAFVLVAIDNVDFVQRSYGSANMFDKAKATDHFVARVLFVLPAAHACAIDLPAPFDASVRVEDWFFSGETGLREFNQAVEVAMGGLSGSDGILTLLSRVDEQMSAGAAPADALVADVRVLPAVDAPPNTPGGILAALRATAADLGRPDQCVVVADQLIWQLCRRLRGGDNAAELHWVAEYPGHASACVFFADPWLKQIQAFSTSCGTPWQP